MLALGLGIGANSAIFTVVNSVLLQPLHFDKPQQLIVVRERNLKAGFPQFSLSPGNYLDFNDHNHSFSGIAALLTRPDGQRPRWLLALHRGSVRSAQGVRFLQSLRRHRRRPVILVWDHLPAHRSRQVRQALERHRAWLRARFRPRDSA